MNKRAKNILLTSLYFLLVLVLVYLFVNYVAQRVQVIGDSMDPTLIDKDHLIVEKVTYRFHDPERFDIVVFPYQYEDHTYYIKRVIGLPGETVFIDDLGDIYIDGIHLEEGYGKEVIKNPGRAYEPITLADDEFFVLGDNRNNSLDSRDPTVGNLNRDDITGKAFMRVYPFSDMGVIKHK